MFTIIWEKIGFVDDTRFYTVVLVVDDYTFAIIQGGAPPVMWTLAYNPNNYGYNPLINPSYSTYKPTER